MKRRTPFAAPLLLGLLAAASTPRTAHAQSADALDAIVLHDGTTLRGHVSEIHPGRDTTVVLITGESRVVPAADIASASGPAFAAATTPVLPPIAVQPTVDPAALTPAGFDLGGDDYRRPAPGRAPLTIASPGGRQIIATEVPAFNVRGFTATRPRQLCMTPCTLFVPPGLRTLEFGGQDFVVASRAIEVPEAGLAVTLHARTSALSAAVVTLDVFGVTAMFASLPTLLVGALESSTHGNARTIELSAGAASLAVGTALVVLGLVLDAANPSGIASSGPLRPNARGAVALRFGVAPTAEGATAALGATF